MIDSSDNRYEPRTVLHMLWRRKWPVVLCVVTLPLLAYGATSRIKKTYQASAIVQVQGAAVDTTLFTPTPSISQPQAIAATAKLAQTSQVAAPAARLLNLPASSVPALLSKVAVTEDDTTGFVTIGASDGSAARSAAIANAFARAVVALRSSQAQGQVNRTVAAVAQRLALLPSSEVTARTQLSDQLQRLRAVAAAQVSNAQIIKFATPPSAPASPKPGRDAGLALVLGLLLGLGLAFLLDRLDRRIRTVEELEEITDLPLLGAVPSTAFHRANVANRNEAFQTLRTSLTYFNVDRPLKSVMVTSAGPSEGKTTVAMNLAISFADSGRSVILLDTDLRRSSLLPLLEIDGYEGPGLALVLASGMALADALYEIPTTAGSLHVLHAGLPPPNPSELLGSANMARLMEEAHVAAEIVVIDSSPLLAVSDCIPLLAQVSGVILLARLQQTTRDALHRYREIVRLARGNMLGVVATDAPDREGYGYGYTHGPIFIDETSDPEATPVGGSRPTGKATSPKRRARVADADATPGKH